MKMSYRTNFPRWWSRRQETLRSFHAFIESINANRGTCSISVDIVAGVMNPATYIRRIEDAAYIYCHDVVVWQKNNYIHVLVFS
jgi:hypothetical protein